MKTAALLIAALALFANRAAMAAAPGACGELSSVRSQALDRHAELGDDRAARCLAIGLGSLDGGDLEDALVALGRYGDRRPMKLLALTQQGTLTMRSLADAVRMLPLSYSDDFGRQQLSLKARRDRFREVSQPRLSAQRGLALRSIDAALAELAPARKR